MSETWMQTLRRGSFRGVQIWVETEEFAGGRRLVIHEFPNSDIPYIEDLGQQARRFTLTAYAVGPDAGSVASGVIQACTAPGAGSLTLPMLGTLRAHCLNVSTIREKDRHGFVAFTMEFVTAENQTAALASSSEMAYRTQAMAEAMPPLLKASFIADYATLNSPQWVADDATELVREWVVEVEALAVQQLLDHEALPPLRQKLQDLYDDAPELVIIGSTANYSSQTFWVTFEDEQLDAELVDRVTEITRDLREVVPAIDGVRIFGTLADYNSVQPRVSRVTINRQVVADNYEAMMSLFRRSALMEHAVAAVNIEYEARRDAIEQRHRIVADFERELSRINTADHFTVYQAMQDLQGQVVDFLSAEIANLARVVVVRSQRLMPSLYYTWRFYGHAGRMVELWRRNGVKHPTFMPTEFEMLTE